MLAVSIGVTGALIFGSAGFAGGMAALGNVATVVAFVAVVLARFVPVGFVPVGFVPEKGAVRPLFGALALTDPGVGGRTC